MVISEFNRKDLDQQQRHYFQCPECKEVEKIHINTIHVLPTTCDRGNIIDYNCSCDVCKIAWQERHFYTFLKGQIIM